MMRKGKTMGKDVFVVGVDVGCYEVWVVAGEHENPRSFPHTNAGLRRLHRWAKKKAGEQKLHLCLESTGVYGVSAASRWAGEENTEVSIVNPAQVAAFARAQLRRCKSDPVDTRTIWAFAVSQRPPAWQAPPRVLRQLYELVHLADRMEAQIRQWHNRQHAREFVADVPPQVAQIQASMIRSLQKHLAKVQRTIAELCTLEPELARQVNLLCTIKGVGRKSAIQLLAYGQNGYTTRGAKALVAHSGLAPHPKQSGSSLHSPGRIDKRGNVRLRRALYMPTLVAVHHNPMFVAFYQRLCKEKGKKKMVALVAAMKKMLLLVRAILRTNKPFNPQLARLT